MSTPEAAGVEGRSARYRPFRNWAGSQTCVPAHTLEAQSEQEVVDAVRFALRDNVPLRAMGSGLSFSPVCQTGGLLLDLSALSGIAGIDGARGRARVRAGTKVWELGQLLWDSGYSLPNQGALDAQGIVGATATGTHGTGVGLGCMSSLVRWIRLVDGRGELIEIGEDEPDRLHAAQVALGTLGVFLEVELDVVPRYHLAETVSYPAWEECSAHWSDARAHRHYAVMWFPTDDAPAKYGIPVPGEPMADRAFEHRLDLVELEDESHLVAEFGARRERAYRVLSLGEGAMPPLYHELEYMVPADRGLEAAAAVREFFREGHPDHAYPVFIRFVAGDPAFLSPFHHRDSVALSIGSAPDGDHWPLFRDVDRLLAGFSARAHWGKNHLLTRDRLRELYPRYDDFVRIRRELDPNGIFLNDHTRALVG